MLGRCLRRSVSRGRGSRHGQVLTVSSTAPVVGRIARAATFGVVCRWLPSALRRSARITATPGVRADGEQIRFSMVAGELTS
jgi:hypothetical protein